MEKDEEESDSPGWTGSFFMQTAEDVARAVRSAQPSVEYSLKDENGGPLQRLQHHVSRIMKGLSSPPQVKRGLYNPEILTIQKRQWANFQLQALDHRIWKDPSKLFESMVIVGLPPDSDIQSLQNLYFARKFEGSGRLRNTFGGQDQSFVEPILEPQVLFVYPPEKQLPLKYKELLSYCFPAGVEVNAAERTPSMSELNEILLGQEHLKQSDLSFIFRLQFFQRVLGNPVVCSQSKPIHSLIFSLSADVLVADDPTLYGCCILAEEMIHRPTGLISMISDGQPLSSFLGRRILTTRRCYCILSRLPFFELHFGVLNSILSEERLERLKKQINILDFESSVSPDLSEIFDKKSHSSPQEDGVVSCKNEIVEASEFSNDDSTSQSPIKYTSHLEHGNVNKDELLNKEPNGDIEHDVARRLPDPVLPLLRFHQCESPESSSSFQDSPIEDRHSRSDVDEADKEEASSSGRDIPSEHSDILDWAKTNNHGSLRIICEYYQLSCPPRGSTIKFHPLDHLHPLEYHRPDERILFNAGSTFYLRSCNTSLALAKGHSALMVEEETASLSVWAVASLCGSLRLEHVLTLFAGALLEKQIVFICSNLGILSALVLSMIPLIRPYQWQSLLMPILPNDMLGFLDAPVPYIVGVKNKTTEMQSKLTNAILVDANRNQVKSQTIPHLPQHRELYACLSPYHAKLVGESYLAKKRPVYECTDVQVEAAQGFLGMLHSYLDSLCSNLRSHTITNVQSNEDKVSLLLKESFIESFPSRDRPFMKLFVDTQLFSVHTDSVLSFFQKE